MPPTVKPSVGAVGGTGFFNGEPALFPSVDRVANSDVLGADNNSDDGVRALEAAVGAIIRSKKPAARGVRVGVAGLTPNIDDVPQA
jgi:hypothetical protein